MNYGQIISQVLSKEVVVRRVLLFLMVLNVFSLVASEFDRDIVVLDQTRNEKVELVFREMMNNYEEENLMDFFSFVSEDRFNQDYMTFSEAIEEDFRIYDILNVETWVDKITDDGVKRYLYIRWDKRYESTSSDTEINQLGYTRFLFDEINGEYKLVELAGNNFWGGSLPEWTEEVSDIAGQEPETIGLLPDLIITSATDDGNSQTTIVVKNQGEKDVTSSIKVINNDTGNEAEYTGGLIIGDSVNIVILFDNTWSVGDITEVDPDNTIEESDETNNQSTLVP